MTRLKLCGLWRTADIDAANEALPDYIGFVFAPSRRQVRPAEAARLRERLAPQIRPVGVFAHAPIEEIAALYRQGVIALAQLHGGEGAAYIEALRERCAVPVIQALRMDRPGAAESIAHEAAYLLLDHGSGGTGAVFDWKSIPPLPKPYFLAGGIGLDNIEAALALKPYAVDISSGAETGGGKDRKKMLALAKKVRNAA
ncbi:MAG: phosphoribosylanthranilate isomerase [Oscillospiraceae bacterium]|jgi:phosphoribosylanthranilate isomerase|nr:phosphoribosylanthranilate isomerase [Oscillospiraceae bacterium]